jgi:hypothetical protein
MFIVGEADAFSIAAGNTAAPSWPGARGSPGV